MTRNFLSYCVCPHCRGGLKEDGGQLVCALCHREHEIIDNIPILLPKYDDEIRSRYLKNYQNIAEDDLHSPIVKNRDRLFHDLLIRFIGNVQSRSVLDIGSANAAYLRRIDARVKVAVDLALPYLKQIPSSCDVIPICGDGEYLPVKPQFFDIIIISDILEHLLHPERLVNILYRWCTPNVRIIVHIPWEESLDQYKEGIYEFVHLRSFRIFTFRRLFKDFYIKREKSTLPLMEDPIIFQLQAMMPGWLGNYLYRLYFTTELSQIEYRFREKWIAERPDRERLLLKLYKPQVKLFEIRKYKTSAIPNSFIRKMITRWWQKVKKK